MDLPVVFPDDTFDSIEAEFDEIIQVCPFVSAKKRQAYAYGAFHDGSLLLNHFYESNLCYDILGFFRFWRINGKPTAENNRSSLRKRFA